MLILILWHNCVWEYTMKFHKRFGGELKHTEALQSCFDINNYRDIRYKTIGLTTVADFHTNKTVLIYENLPKTD